MDIRAPTLACLLVILLPPTAAFADAVQVRYLEGLTRGFLAVSDENGQQIGEGDWQQVLHGDRVTSHLTIRFRDGSVYDDQTVFTQHGIFHLLTDHVTQKGPTFKPEAKAR